MTKNEYIESLRKLNLKVYFKGELIENPVDHPMIRPSMNSVAKTYELAEKEELFNNPRHPYTKALLAAIPVIDITARDREPELLKGEVSSPVNPVNYCRFYTRCRYACEKCREHEYELKQVSENHYSACILEQTGEIGNE